MILNNIGYSYRDLTIVPKEFSDITSRSECNPKLDNGYLPIFTAPMSSVVGKCNYELFDERGIIPIIPRNVPINSRLKIGLEGYWIAVSLKEFKEFFIEGLVKTPNKVCVDIANGHMRHLLDLCKRAKTVNPNLEIMLGNIANPNTFHELTINNARFKDVSDVKLVDYIRVSIGSGAGCITSSNTGIHYPVASLIDECSKYKSENSPMLIADGGIRNYDDVIKALALGADYVMIGSLFAKCIESAGEKYYKTYDGTYRLCPSPSDFYEDKIQIYTKFYGMASADGQIAISGKKTKTAEGITKLLEVEYELHKWVDNMQSYLRSAMSYCNSKTLEDFIGKQTLIINSNINSINK